MNSFVLTSNRLFSLITLCTALLMGPPVLAAPDVTMAKLGVSVFPDGCGNPFSDSASFFMFYEQGIQMIAARRGPQIKGVAELFAVSELKSELDALIINPQEESAIDRLIQSQLCFYQKVQMQQKMSGSDTKANPLTITSSEESLHEHLLSVSPKLFRDARKIVVEAMAERAKAREKENILQQKWADVRKAREQGRSKIRDLFD